MTDEKQSLIIAYKYLLNKTLPEKYQSPVKYNHCFNRIILDWLFKDCWYNHLDKSSTAISQLSVMQLKQMVQHMQTWLDDKALLIADNNASLTYRKKLSV